MYLNQVESKSKVPITCTPRILLVNAQKFLQDKLQKMFSGEAELNIVGTTSDAQNALVLVESLKPDMILFNIEMPEMNGIKAIKTISQQFPDCKILVISIHEYQEYIQKVISVRADAYLLQNIPTEKFMMTIYSICQESDTIGKFKKHILALNN